MAILQPRKEKHRKQFRGKRRGLAVRGSSLAFGFCGLKSKERGWLTAQQIEAARKAMTHYTKRGGRIWIRIFPHKPVTHKPAEVRMGSGKGDVSGHVAVVKPGMILFEMGAVSSTVAQEAMRLAAHKLPVKTVFISKKQPEVKEK